jgi:hypothetical protein
MEGKKNFAESDLISLSVAEQVLMASGVSRRVDSSKLKVRRKFLLACLE